MTRLKQAWLALCGKLEPEVRYLPEPAQLMTLYVAERPNGVRGYSWRSYLTCEQAHSENPGYEVRTVTAFKSGGKVYRANYLWEVEVQPKPKRPKGKR